MEEKSELSSIIAGAVFGLIYGSITLLPEAFSGPSSAISIGALMNFPVVFVLAPAFSQGFGFSLYVDGLVFASIVIVVNAVLCGLLALIIRKKVSWRNRILVFCGLFFLAYFAPFLLFALGNP